MKKINCKSIKILFDSDENIEINFEDISDLQIDFIKEHISFDFIEQITYRYYSCGELLISLKDTCDYDDGVSSVFDRINDSNDILGIEMIYENSTKDTYMVNWHSEYDDYNKYQKTNINEYNCLVIDIKEENYTTKNLELS